MKNFSFFLILVFLLAVLSAEGQTVTGFGVQFGAGPDSGKVFIIQEQRATIPEGGWQNIQTVRDLPNIPAAESLVQAQMKAADSEMERLVKIKKDLAKVSETLAGKKVQKPEAPVKKLDVVKKE